MVLKIQHNSIKFDRLKSNEKRAEFERLLDDLYEMCQNGLLDKAWNGALFSILHLLNPVGYCVRKRAKLCPRR